MTKKDDLPPLIWEAVSLLAGLDVIELMGDDGLDAWCAATVNETQQHWNRNDQD